EWDSCRNGVNGQIRAQFAGRQPEHGSYGVAIMDPAELGIALAHFAEGRRIGAILEGHGDLADFQIQLDQARAAVSAYDCGRTESWMAGKRKLLFDREDAYFYSVSALLGCV